MARDGDVTRDEVTAVIPLSGAERQRRYRERRKRERQASAGSGVQPDGSWVPEFPGQRPAFQPGNRLGELVATHGARSPSRVDEVARRVTAELFADPSTPPYLQERSYRPAVTAWASAEAICRLLRDWLAGQDVAAAMTELTEGDEAEEQSGGKVRRSMRTRRVASVLDQLHRHETRAMHLRARLGLDPLSRARLGADVAGAKLDLARYWAEQDANDKQTGAV